VCLVLALSGRALAQPASPWHADLSGDRAAVTDGGIESTWTTTHLQAMWARPDVGGWLAAVDLSARGALDDVTVSTRGYRRLGDWTIAGGAGVTPHADFLYRAAADAELSRRIFGSVVASGAYRFMAFPTADIHQPQAALTWYHRRGEVETRGYFTRNTTAERTTTTVLARTAFALNSRMGINGGAAFGDRIFDISSLPSSTGESHQVFATLRMRVSRSDWIEAGLSQAREAPSFTYRSLILAYRRAF
jgi:YaiO family outer membrane protein